MNGGIIGKKNTTAKGVWTPGDVVLDTNNITKKPITIDGCDATTGWLIPDAGRSVALLTSGQHGGSGWLTTIKTSTSEFWFSTGKFFGLGATGKSIGLWFYVKDSAVLAKIATVTIGLMDDIAKATSYRTWYARHAFTSITTGWQLLEYPVSSFNTIIGTPNFSLCPFLEVSFDAVSNSSTFASGDVGFDDVFYRRS